MNSLHAALYPRPSLISSPNTFFLLPMASSALLRPFPPPRPRLLRHHHRHQSSPVNSVLVPRCSTPDSNPDELPEIPPAAATTTFDIEKRWKSAILRDGRQSTSYLEKSEPPNFEIGWKRTKEIKVEKPKGWVIADFLEKLDGLMGRRQYGSAELLAKTGAVVAERAWEEAEVLLAGGEVEERMVTELGRVLRLMEMDLQMVKAAVKEETLAQRLEQARARCRQAILVALSF